MSTIHLDTDQIQTRQEALDYLKTHQIKSGDEIRVLTDEEQGTLAYSAIIVLVIVVVIAYFNLAQRLKGGDQILDQVFGDKSNEELEQEIKEQYGISIKVERKDKNRDEWTQFAAKGLSDTYNEDEPDYSDVELKAKNPNYQGPAPL